MQILFFTRLALYLLAFIIPVYHPVVAVPYDFLNKWIFFILVPSEMFLAFYIRPPRFRLLYGFIPGVLLILLTVFLVSGADNSSLLVIFVGLFAYGWTLFIFSTLNRGVGFATLEMFLLGTIYYKLLSYSRASEDLANQSASFTMTVLILAILTFLLHALILYLVAFPDRRTGKRRRELIIFFAVVLPVVLLLAVVLPADFVKHQVVFNEFNEEPPPQPRDLEGEGFEGESGSEGQQQKDPNKNGLPLGDRNEKYPSELRGKGASSGQGKKEGSEGGGQGEEGKDQEGQGGGGSRNGEEGGGGGGQNRNDGQGGGGGGSNGGGGQGGGGQGQNQGGQGQGNRQEQNKLQGVPSDQWDNLDSSNGAKGKQKAVMVIASKVDPVYAAEAYWGDYEQGKGFEVSRDQSLNKLTRLRLPNTWREKNSGIDLKRKKLKIFYLSTIKNRVLAYRPVEIQPTVQDITYHPFDLSYHAVSAMSVSLPEDWKTLRDLDPAERKDLSHYLKADLSPERAKKFDAFLEKALRGKTGYFERLDAVLRSLSDHRYKLGYDEDTSIGKLEKFLFETKEGDCTEFAHTVALLGRRAGIPARVVTGYLAARDLQTMAHRKGTYLLRKKIPLLQKFDLSELFLVTTSHHHAWVEFYLPGYGWIDFESTAFAIPPKPEFDPNNQDVIIPLIEEELHPKDKKFKFPWRFFFKALGFLAGLVVLSLYSFRYGRELYFYTLSRKEDDRGLRALLRLLLMRMAVYGYPLKHPSRTPLEYAKEHEEMEEFATHYTMLRFREIYAPGEKEEVWKRLRNSYGGVKRELRRRGIVRRIRSVISLRSLYY